MDILVIVGENHHIVILNGFQPVPYFFQKRALIVRVLSFVFTFWEGQAYIE